MGQVRYERKAEQGHRRKQNGFKDCDGGPKRQHEAQRHPFEGVNKGDPRERGTKTNAALTVPRATYKQNYRQRH